MVFPVVMYGCESWAIKKAECQRIDIFELWCWRRFLRVPWTARRSVNPKGNQPWIFTRTDAEAPTLWPPDVKSQLTGKDPDAGKDWGQEEKGQTGWDGWMASLTQWTWIWANSRRWWWTGRCGMLPSTWSQSRTQLSDGTATEYQQRKRRVIYGAEIRISTDSTRYLFWKTLGQSVKGQSEYVTSGNTVI